MESGAPETKPKNRGVVYLGPRHVEVQDIPYPKFTFPDGKRPCPSGVIVKVLLSCICGSDLHMYNGRTPLPPPFVFGHEITGEVFEVGPDVEYIKKGDLVSLPFNIACGRCSNCKSRNTNVCLNVNPMQPGGAYGYVMMGGWQGGQAEYVFVPYADFNCLKLPPLKECRDKLLDLSLITDIFPTGFHPVFTAGVNVGSAVFIVGAGPVGLACAESSRLLGASHIFVADSNKSRLELVTKMGWHAVDSTQELEPQVQAVLGKGKLVDVAVDCVGFEAHGMHDPQVKEPIAALNECQQVVKVGGKIGIPGVYLSVDPKAPTAAEKAGIFPLQFGKIWEKAVDMVAVGQCPVMRYNERLLTAILAGKTRLSEIVNATVISLDEAPQAYREFVEGVPKKFIIDVHGMLSK
eukprot:TRINITY_DN11624_c0_g1_i1.p1 TRINITY_DN11624_c0_g1~~TRINITY_DN11624_c0_g1_i1.p1  ORF type:complete len:406 (-),score=97.70 TRINITY_DN11624_c0_g1_i1:6-1223(-)